MLAFSRDEKGTIMGFSCGIKWVKKDEKGDTVFKQNSDKPVMEECIHDSRRAALACTRRLMQVDLSNEATELKAKLEQAIRINVELAKQVEALTEENASMTDTCNKVPGLERLVVSLEEKNTALETQVAELTPKGEDAPEEAMAEEAPKEGEQEAVSS